MCAHNAFAFACVGLCRRSCFAAGAVRVNSAFAGVRTSAFAGVVLGALILCRRSPTFAGVACMCTQRVCLCRRSGFAAGAVSVNSALAGVRTSAFAGVVLAALMHLLCGRRPLQAKSGLCGRSPAFAGVPYAYIYSPLYTSDAADQLTLVDLSTLHLPLHP